MCFEQSSGTDSKRCGKFDAGLDLLPSRLLKQDGNDGRGIEEQSLDSPRPEAQDVFEFGFGNRLAEHSPGNGRPNMGFQELLEAQLLIATFSQAQAAATFKESFTDGLSLGFASQGGQFSSEGLDFQIF